MYKMGCKFELINTHFTVTNKTVLGLCNYSTQQSRDLKESKSISNLKYFTEKQNLSDL